MAADRDDMTRDSTEETSGEREELRSVVAQLRTNIAARGRSGLLGVPLAAAPPKKSGRPGRRVASRRARRRNPRPA